MSFCEVFGVPGGKIDDIAIQCDRDHGAFSIEGYRRVALHEGDGAFDLVAGLVIDLGADDGVGVDD